MRFFGAKGVVCQLATGAIVLSCVRSETHLNDFRLFSVGLFFCEFWNVFLGGPYCRSRFRILARRGKGTHKPKTTPRKRGPGA
uniref:Putative secreted protein n=1 Tax=Anopheles darlingi TaxID=43151 RepID=A0A2M4DJU1_ANODA